MSPALHIFGIRHHGPGSARSLRQAFESLKPDAILVEGPPEADDVLPLLAHEQMTPPVAILVYVPDDPRRAVYYPFAVFSPEWQAIHYALTHNIPVRFMDLPQAYQLGEKEKERDKEKENQSETETVPLGPPALPPAPTEAELIRMDPIRYIAEKSGYSDSERWWEHIIEQRRDSREVFRAILELMTALRAEADAAAPNPDPRETQREAHMRQTIRAVQKEGYERIAIVCGAWHGPALINLPPAKNDAAILKGLTKTKVLATWVPWTHGRLASRTGYGAGVESPGWYQHLWSSTDEIAIRWMTKIAHLLRGEDLDASSAHVIEAVRLAESLAALRDRPLPGLVEMNEAAEAVFCSGNALPMRLIQERLVIGDALGHVPDETPMVPLQRDLVSEQKRLKLRPEAEARALNLDLRKPTDLERSHLLHRLNLLKIEWGKPQKVGRLKQGTFHENWQIQWQPEFAIALIEAAAWGNTVHDAAVALTRHSADQAPDLPALTQLVDHVLLADLPEAVDHLMTRVQTEAAVANDVTHLMAALPPLANILRYGNVRKTDAGTVGRVVDGLVARICVGLPAACASLNDDAAEAMYNYLLGVHSAIGLLRNDEHTQNWHAVLTRLADQQGLHNLLAGRCCRLLLDADVFTRDDAAQRMSLALSTAVEPIQAAAWIEGFLKGSGALLIYDEGLWQVLDEWVMSLSGETFIQLLPLLRRTFSTFSAPERRQMGERVKHGPRASASADGDGEINVARAEAVLPLVARLLGVDDKP